MKISKKGYTLIEMVLVVAIIVILASIATFSVGDAVRKYRAESEHLEDHTSNFEVGANTQVKAMLYDGQDQGIINALPSLDLSDEADNGDDEEGEGGNVNTPTPANPTTDPTSTPTPNAGNNGDGSGSNGVGSGNGDTGESIPAITDLTSDNGIHVSTTGGWSGLQLADGSLFLSNSEKGVRIKRVGDSVIVAYTNATGDNIWGSSTFSSYSQANSSLSSLGITIDSLDELPTIEGQYSGIAGGSEYTINVTSDWSVVQNGNSYTITSSSGEELKFEVQKWGDVVVVVDVNSDFAKSHGVTWGGENQAMIQVQTQEQRDWWAAQGITITF